MKYHAHHWDGTFAFEGFTDTQIAQLHHVRRAFRCDMFDILGVIAAAGLRRPLSEIDGRILTACNAVTGVRCERVRSADRRRKPKPGLAPVILYSLAA